MTFGEAIASGFRNYANGSGRASRSEYWFWFLFTLVVAVVSAILDLAIFPDASTGPFGILATLAIVLPDISVGVRRLHDIDRTGWWMLLSLTIIGGILLVIWACLRGSDGPNDYGPDPLT